jgi:predicted transcriptional regulator
MATDNNKGIVYLLTNECMPGVVKIGMTSREDMDARLRELYTTGVPLPFDCVYACKVDCFKELEQALHEAFEPQRVNPNREFFRIKPSQAIGILKLFNKGNVTAEVVKEMENDLAEEDEKSNPKRRSSINFTEMGLNVGDTLVYVHDSKQTCVIKSARKVEYNGEETSLTAVTTKLLGTKWKVQPTPHWTYNDKSLSDIYNEWQERLAKEETEED